MEKSFQAIKDVIFKKEETLKTLQKTHPHLAHLSEVEILAYFNIETISELEQHIKTLLPVQDDLPLQEHKLCSCTDSTDQPKELYDSEASAQKEAHTLATLKRVKLKVYPCPDNCGWHLSKK